MKICIATTDAEIAACFPVMSLLRAHIPEHEFVERVRRQESAGYRLAFVQEEEGIFAVAGFRIAENLAWGRFLYVDDLVTDPAHRSRGYGAALLDWLRDHAVQQGCLQLHLDSGIKRKDAHRFYKHAGLTNAGLHFMQHLAPKPSLSSEHCG